MKFKFWLLAVALLLAPELANAQSVVKICVPGTFPSCQDVNSSNPLPVTSSGAGVSANIAQFGGTNLSTGTGAGGAGIPRVTVSNDSTFGIAPSSSAGVGITPVVSASAEASHVLKAGAGNLYSVYASNLTATAGYLVVVNSATAPGDGAITPLECVPLPANGFASINYNPGPPAVFATGITAVITSATTCFTKTTGVITGYIKGAVQ